MLPLSIGRDLLRQEEPEQLSWHLSSLKFLAFLFFLKQMCIFHRGLTHRKGADSHCNLGEVSSYSASVYSTFPLPEYLLNPQQNFLVSWLGELTEDGEIISLWVQLPRGAGHRNASIIRIVTRGWLMPVTILMTRAPCARVGLFSFQCKESSEVIL